jgi:hypothetical protein
MKRVVRAEPQLVAAARGFVADFGELRLANAIAEAQRTSDTGTLASALWHAAEAVRGQAEVVTRAAQKQADNLMMAKELDVAADRIEQVAKQRYAAMTRRAKMMKRHLREDLHALVEDASESPSEKFMSVPSALPSA